MLSLAAGLAAGCIGKPDKANIGLRKDKQGLEEKIEELDKKRQNDAALIASLRADRPTLPTLPPERLAQLYTTRGLKFGRLTGGFDLDRTQPGEEALRLYVVPVDQDGQPLKAAGSFVVSAFDLSEADRPLVGTWQFDVDAAKKNWRGELLDYTYVLTLPMKTFPAHSELTLKVEFTEALTGLKFDSQTIVTFKLPPATQRTTKTATRPG